MPEDNGSGEYIHGVDKRMITYGLSQMLLLTIIFSATRTPANVQGARDFSKKGKSFKNAVPQEWAKYYILLCIFVHKDT